MKQTLVLAVVVCGWLGAATAAPPAGQEEFEFKDGKWVPATEPVEGTEQGHLALVRKLIERGEGRSALRATKRFFKIYPDSPRREEALLLAGRAEIVRGRYWQAFEWLEEQLAEYPAGRYYEWALSREFEVAEAFLAGKKRIHFGIFRLRAEGDGLDILLRIAEHAPGTTIAQKAMLRIADHQYEKARFAEAAAAYDEFLEMFPKSAQAQYAALQAARSTHAQFQGVAFDDTPLLEATQRYLNFQQAYPGPAREADVEAILAEITAARANKLFETGAFYERTDRPDSATFYYKLVMRDFPQTEWADRAGAALSMMAGGEPGEAEGEPYDPPAEPVKTPDKKAPPAAEPVKKAPAGQKGGA
jgi:outer membrane assembly lipoprotein YfiO